MKKIEVVDTVDTKRIDEQFILADEFDLDAFFESEAPKATEEKNTRPIPELLLTLRSDANEAITTIATSITAETFAAGASLTSTVFNALSSLAGSCGLFCMHSLGSLSQASTSLSGISSMSGLPTPSFGVDADGNFHLDGNIHSLAEMTGISPLDLRSGKFAAEDILSKFISVFGKNIGFVFGFGLIESIIDCMFDSFMPVKA